MTYQDGVEVRLGDLVSVPIPSGHAEARVVMLGEDYSHLDLEQGFLDWVTRERVLEAGSLVVEWIGLNPFAHEDPRYAPVGRYLFTRIDVHVRLIAPARIHR